MMPAPTRRGRVAESHDIARSAFVSALAFAVLAIGWSIYALATGGSWWGALHSFLAGTVLLAISGASQLFTITWSSTVPPTRIAVSTQRWLVIAGVGAVLVGVTFGVPALVWAGGAATVAGVALLAWLITAAVRKSLLRRFDLSAHFYLTAFVAGILGVTLGTMMGAGINLSWISNVRLVHAHLNLTGLVGLMIIGTVPTLLPTTANSRAVIGREAIAALWIARLGVLAITAGLWVPEFVGVGTLSIGVAGALILGGILLRLWTKGKEKLAFLQIATGSLWLIGWSVVEGAAVMVTGTMAHFGSWTAAVVLAGVGQVLAGSFAYIVPVLKGSPFTANREILEGHGWLPIMAVNAGALCLGLGFSAAGIVLLTLWVGDFGIRVVRVVMG